MSLFLKLFENHTQYENYINGSDAILPNVSLCVNENDVHYNPYVETRVVAQFNVTSTSSPTQLCYSTAVSQFSEIEIDGVTQLSVVSTYTFSTTGEHTVKYTLTDPTSIGNMAFYLCSGLTSIDIPSGVTSIGDFAFYQCSNLTSIVIPNGVTRIGNYALAYCSSLTSCIIGSGVTRIDDGAFAYCSSLTSCIIGSGVTSISDSAFYECSGLTSITSNATTAPTITSTTFQNVKTNGTLRVPIGSSGYDVWMGTSDYYLGLYSWTKVEQ